MLSLSHSVRPTRHCRPSPACVALVIGAVESSSAGRLITQLRGLSQLTAASFQPMNGSRWQPPTNRRRGLPCRRAHRVVSVPRSPHCRSPSECRHNIKTVNKDPPQCTACCRASAILDLRVTDLHKIIIRCFHCILCGEYWTEIPPTSEGCGFV